MGENDKKGVEAIKDKWGETKKKKNKLGLERSARNLSRSLLVCRRLADKQKVDRLTAQDVILDISEPFAFRKYITLEAEMEKHKNIARTQIFDQKIAQ